MRLDTVKTLWEEELHRTISVVHIKNGRTDKTGNCVQPCTSTTVYDVSF